MTHEEMIMSAHDELMKALPENFGEPERTLIEEAYVLAKKAHAHQTRKSGLPYILHPLAVALIVVKEMRQRNKEIVCAALLHDVVEDTEYSIWDIQEMFGDEIMFLVAAVTKPNKEQEDNFKHILSSVQGDVRVLILKLSDRLHNMRTLSSMRPEKQWKIASETQFFFAPLAGRLGLYKMKSELENLAFKYLNPQEYTRIEKLLEEDKERTKVMVESFMYDCLHTVGKVFSGAVGWDIRYRQPYSIWREMQELGCDFYHVPFKHYIRAGYDMEDVEDETSWSRWDFTEEQVAMTIYSTLVTKYKEQTGSFVNYMSQPKANGYRAVHFRLLNPYGTIEEFHVASDDMRLQANYGCILESKEQWMKRLTSVLDELAKDPETMMTGIKETLFNEDIVVYTPKAKPITLPKKATALDFAYEVHTDIGNHAKCARINGHLSSISTVLHRGDSVEIITDESIHPEIEWFEAAVTYKAKKHIRDYFKTFTGTVYNLCPHCHPLPESNELIGFDDGQGNITVHSRNCPDAIRSASEQGNRIVAVDFKPEDDKLYPVSIRITGIDRYHLLQDILDCIVEGFHLSMSALASDTKDHIFSGTITFAVHSATERDAAVSKIAAIDGVEEVNVVKI